MEKHVVEIKEIKHINHDVLQIVTEKPAGYTFVPGQATEVSINKKEWKEEGRPFTFSNLPHEKDLEFVIKIYPSHKGVTNELSQLKKGDELVLHDVFGTIQYQGEGVFIAGGAGVTPFISIFRDLQQKNQLGGNKLIFANKTKKDIILAQEFKDMLGENFINILAEEKVDDHAHGLINEQFLKDNIKNFDQKFYLCGPEPMMEVLEEQLSNLNVSPKSIIKEGM